MRHRTFVHLFCVKILTQFKGNPLYKPATQPSILFLTHFEKYCMNIQHLLLLHKFLSLYQYIHFCRLNVNFYLFYLFKNYKQPLVLLPCKQTLSSGPHPTSCLRVSLGPCKLSGNCRDPCQPPSPWNKLKC